MYIKGFPGGASGIEPAYSAGDARGSGLIRGSGRSPTPVLLPEESHGQRSLVGYSPWGYKETDMTEAA